MYIYVCAQLKIERMAYRKWKKVARAVAARSQNSFGRVHFSSIFEFDYNIKKKFFLLWHQVHAKFACWTQTIDHIVLCHSFIRSFISPFFSFIQHFDFPIVKTQKNEFTTYNETLTRRKKTQRKHVNSQWLVCIVYNMQSHLCKTNPSILFKLTYTLFCNTQQIYVTFVL